jgi:hypothetical protein
MMYALSSNTTVAYQERREPVYPSERVFGRPDFARPASGVLFLAGTGLSIHKQ